LLLITSLFCYGQRLKCCCYATGIDVGNSSSGFAVALTSDSAALLWFSWPGEFAQQPKTLTALLYDTATWKPVA
jgi:hypothetical protein